MFDPLSELLIRILDESNNTDSNSTDSNSTDTGDAGGNDGGDGADGNTGFPFQDGLMAYQKWGYVILAFLILFCLCFSWRCCKRRRDRRNLQLDSARADNVLGDMAMVPTDEIDEDAELL